MTPPDRLRGTGDAGQAAATIEPSALGEFFTCLVSSSVKLSGFGREGLRYAIEGMTEMKLVTYNRR